MMDTQITDLLVNTAKGLAGDAATALVTPDWESLALQLITQVVDSCFGGGTPKPTPAGSPIEPGPDANVVAERLKNMTPLQQAALRIRSKRQYVKKGMTPSHGLLFANSMIKISQDTKQEDLSAAVAHIQGVNDSFPDMEMF